MPKHPEEKGKGLLTMDEVKYNLPHFIAWMMGKRQVRQVAKEISCLRLAPRTPEEFYLCDLSDTQAYLARNLERPFEKALLQKAYFILAGKRLSAKKAQSIVKEFYLANDLCGLERTSKVLEVISREITFRKIEFSCLILWFLARRDYQTDIYPKPFFFKSIKKRFRTGERILPLLLNMKLMSKKPGKKNDSPDSEEIIHYFETNVNQISLNFRVSHLYLYGSYADGTNNSSSDLDLLIVFDKGVLSMERSRLSSELKEKIKKEVGLSVDILPFDYAMDDLDIQAMQSIKTII